MAVPFVQLGQCGNQAGAALFDRLYQEGCKAFVRLSSYAILLFNETPKDNCAKAFLIYMLPKLVNKNLTQQRSWRYNKDYSYVKR
jgi:hypothetical protein